MHLASGEANSAVGGIYPSEHVEDLQESKANISPVQLMEYQLTHCSSTKPRHPAWECQTQGNDICEG